MTIDEIFSKINGRLIEGEMFHSQMTEYWSFFGYLNRFRDMHYKHMIDEINMRNCLNNYFIEHYGRLIPKSEVSDPNVIPSNFYTMSSHNINGNSKNYIKAGIEKYYNWEVETMNIVKQCYNNIVELGDICALEYIKTILNNVNCDITCSYTSWLKYKALDYDISDILKYNKG